MPQNAQRSSSQRSAADAAVRNPAEQKQSRQQAREDEQEGHERASPRVQVVHAAVREEGEDELHRPAAALFWSGLAAGMSISFSFIAEGLLRAALPEAHWTGLVAELGYSLGFLIVILGRQQLFTENTLTVILPLMERPSFSYLRGVLRVWGVVLAANLIGGVLVAWVLWATPVLEAPVREELLKLGVEAGAPSFGTLLLRGIFAGWLIALLVWLLPAAEAARVTVIILITYLVALGHFSHVIVGTVEVCYAALAGQIGWATALGKFLPAALIGNILGGVSLTAAVNHAQVVAGEPNADRMTR